VSTDAATWGIRTAILIGLAIAFVVAWRSVEEVDRKGWRGKFAVLFLTGVNCVAGVFGLLMTTLVVVVGFAALEGFGITNTGWLDEQGNGRSTQSTTTTDGRPPPCESGYSRCLDPDASDYDCANGEGDGPKYTGFIRVTGSDRFDLDRDGDGIACDF